MRVENLDHRGIISVLIDIVIYDNFENELAKFENIEFDFGSLKLVSFKHKQRRIPNESLESLKARMSEEYNKILIFDKSYNYFSKGSTLQQLEFAFQKGTQIKTKFQVKAIKFDDSQVLKL